ncbi:transcription antitermination regulator [Carbonactinospora thermoautotrophica]|uniref:ANTAR domain-containing protein n=1 Tax=Carbonactinospora thermoautotrophica TaxID=1469144 RepID=UPI00226EA6E2|nr:ANTAR domain-containing protein [Carbonactinospora thermoautotrophica]MCX9191454.1 transcription antitermination regulator [Carbonactinospora thermoautotrophica]
MTAEDIIYQRRVRLLEYAAQVGVSAACRAFGISRTTYYRWEARARRYGLSALMLSTQQLEEALGHVTAMTSRILPVEPSCGVTLMRAGQIATIVPSDGLSPLVDEIQYSTGEGSCVQALRTREVVASQDLRTDPRWRQWRERALAHGVRSVYAHPLEVGQQAVGALNLYARQPGTWAEEAQRVLMLLAEHAALLLSVVIRQASHAELTEQLRAALSSRAVIDQAIGIIMAQRGCDAEKAFAVLREVSNKRNIKLRDVAARLVAGTARAAGGPRRSGKPASQCP